MKRILLLFFLFVAINAKAGDTLTRAQVYNFSVGDTFDYKHYTLVVYRGYGVITDTTTYSRHVITNISYSLDSTIKYIQQERLFPLPDTIINVTLSSLSEYEVFLDTNGCEGYLRTISVASNSEYHGRSIDTLSQAICGPGTELLVFADGLGIALDYLQEGGCGACVTNTFDSTILIYYAKGNEIWGTPYYNIPTALQQLNASTDQIALFPTLNNGIFNVKMTVASMLPINLVVYDITGQKLEQSPLNNLSTEVSIGPHSAGVYIWKAFSSNQLIQTGKMIIR